ncbi:B-cell receptor CD22-like [Toxotes jaculatrix]|uniref:B-cell receptor CD22-like n=1 Tax=Toxotes jaculatrix TaxID=941984 RepID=UPI001B3B1715|nr:B-cell receptor CD22-like [Toxotes jaculatrix]
MTGRSTLRITDLRDSDSAQYRFKFKTYWSEWQSGLPGTTLTVTDAPRVPTVWVSPPGDIMKNSSVTLSCSSDANPPAVYTWYKNNQSLLRKEPQLVFSSIQSSDSGQYYCTAENDLGRRTSNFIFINVKYGPQTSTLSVSPSGEIVEGSSVTLTCSSDANPAADYTWYKENQTLLQGPEDIYNFSSIRSEDRGFYQCKSENQYGQISSEPLFLDVQYTPKLPSVSVSPSAEIKEGSSVTLTCSSDANPAANYTWYKEDEDSAKASGQIFIITNIRAEHSGSYYCEAQNSRGRTNSTFHLTVVPGALKSAAAGTVTAALLALMLLAVFLWIRRKKSRTAGERPDSRAQLNVGPVYDTPSAAAQRRPAEQQDDLHYASICLSPQNAEAVYCNVGRVQPQRGTEEDEEEEDGVDYSVVRFDKGSSAAGTRIQEDGEDPCALYSAVNKKL